MPRYFPDLFPDELFYSGCARFSDRVRYPNRKRVLQELFGGRNVKVSFDLPSHLQTFIDRLSYDHGYTIDILVNQHTLFPMFTPFQPQDRSRKIYEQMISEDGTLIHSKMGGSPSYNIPYLRYCPICVKEDISSFGECYWHRSHQVQGFEICPKHLVFIEDSTVLTRSIFTNLGPTSAERSIKATSTRIANLNNPLHITLIDVAKDIIYILNHPGIFLTPDQFYKQYNNLLAQRDFLTQKGCIRYIELTKNFIEYYTPELLEHLNCSIYNSQAHNLWLARLLRVSKGSSPFLHHLLAINFLGATAEDIFNQKTKLPTPFGSGPWPCLNPVCSNYNKNCIQSFKIKRSSSENGKGVGVFSCVCGFIYSQNEADCISSSTNLKHTVISYGEVWEAKLKELWDDSTITQNRIAQILHMSGQNVTRRARKLQLLIPRKSPTQRGVRPSLNHDVTWYRTEWMKLLQNAQDASLTALSRKVPNLYDWLSRNDRDWFLAHRPLPKAKTRTPRQEQHSFLQFNGRKVEYWSHQDTYLADNVKIVAHQLLAAPSPPKRISLSAICMHISSPIRWLRSKKPEAIPLTIQTLEEVIETREKYAIRRIWFIAQQYRQENINPSRRAFSVKASVRTLLHVPSVKQAFEDALSQICTIDVVFT